MNAEVHGLRESNVLMYFLDKPHSKSVVCHLACKITEMALQSVSKDGWMNEISQENGLFRGDLIDHNLNNLTWWTQSINGYATRGQLTF
jgi:hypothetical protein